MFKRALSPALHVARDQACQAQGRIFVWMMSCFVLELMHNALQESGGTVLSTNWKDVGKGKVTCSPPTGMEKKTFEQ